MSEIDVSLDTCIIDQYVQGRKIGHSPICQHLAIIFLGIVTNSCMNPGMNFMDFFESFGYAPSNYDCISSLQKSLCQSKSNFGCTAGDKHCIA
jgi:hypothetical protein